MPGVKPTSKPRPDPKDLRLPLLRRRADVVEGSFNEEARTVDICWSTGSRGLNVYFGEDIVDAAGKRLEKPDRWSLIEEELSLDEGHVRLEELQAHGPFLDGHRTYGGLDDILGSIRRAWVEKGKAYATISVRPGVRGDEVIAGLRSGDLRSFSAGYRVRRFLDITPTNAKVRRLRAIDWTPKEVSIVPIPFDKGVGVRAEGTDFETCEIARGGGPTNMDEELENGNENTPASERSEGGGTPAPAAAPAATATAPAPSQRSEADEERAVKAERKRIAEIERLYTRNGAPDDLKRQAIDEGWDSARYRGALLDFLDKKDAEIPHGTAHMAHVGQNELDKVRAAAEDALTQRVDPTHKLTVGKDFRGARLIDIGLELLQRRGERITTRDPRVLSAMILGFGDRGRSAGAHSTSDFPLILANVANKGVLKAFREDSGDHTKWTVPGTVTDFKTAQRVRISDAPELIEKGELEEYEFGSFGEEGESVKVKTFGRMVAVSRETIQNDDLSQFAKALPAMGRRARRLERSQVNAQLIANPTMADGVALFHATHGNLGSGVIGLEGLNAAFLAMRLQKAPNGTELDITPRFIIVAPQQEFIARQYLSETIVPTKASDTNIYRGRLEIIVESQLSGLAPAWFLAASPNEVDTVELTRMLGYEEPVLEEQWDWKREAVMWKVRHDCSAKPLDYRGLYKSSGS